MSVVYVLEAFQKDGEAFVAAFPLAGLELRDLQKWFGVEAANPMFDCYPVTESQKAALERAAGVTIDLSRYDYFVTCELV